MRNFLLIRLAAGSNRDKETVGTSIFAYLMKLDDSDVELYQSYRTKKWCDTVNLLALMKVDEFHKIAAQKGMPSDGQTVNVNMAARYFERGMQLVQRTRESIGVTDPSLVLCDRQYKDALRWLEKFAKREHKQRSDVETLMGSSCLFRAALRNGIYRAEDQQAFMALQQWPDDSSMTSVARWIRSKFVRERGLEPPTGEANVFLCSN